MYAEQEQVEVGLKFKTRSSLVVETTGKSLQVSPHDRDPIFAHEVVILEGPNQGSTFLHNLDAAEAV